MKTLVFFAYLIRTFQVLALVSVGFAIYYFIDHKHPPKPVAEVASPSMILPAKVVDESGVYIWWFKGHILYWSTNGTTWETNR